MNCIFSMTEVTEMEQKSEVEKTIQLVTNKKNPLLNQRSHWSEMTAENRDAFEATTAIHP